MIFIKLIIGFAAITVANNFVDYESNFEVSEMIGAGVVLTGVLTLCYLSGNAIVFIFDKF